MGEHYHDYLKLLQQAEHHIAHGRLAEAHAALLRAAALMGGHPEEARVTVWAEAVAAKMKSQRVTALTLHAIRVTPEPPPSRAGRRMRAPERRPQ